MISNFPFFFTVGNFGRNREFFSFCVTAARLDIRFRLKFIDSFSGPKMGMNNEHAFKRYIIYFVHLFLEKASWDPCPPPPVPFLYWIVHQIPSSPHLICACTVYAKEEKGNSQRHILFLPFSGLISHTAHSQEKKKKNTPPPPPCFPIIDSSSCAFIYSFHIFLFFVRCRCLWQRRRRQSDPRFAIYTIPEKKKKNRASRLTAASWRRRRKAQSDACAKKRGFAKYEKLGKMSSFF